MNIIRIITIISFSLMGIKYLRPYGVPIFICLIILIAIFGSKRKFNTSLGKDSKRLFILLICYIIVQLFDLIRASDYEYNVLALVKYCIILISLYCMHLIYDAKYLKKDLTVFLISSTSIIAVFVINSFFYLDSGFLSADLFIKTEQGKNSIAFFCAITSLVSTWFLVRSRRNAFYAFLLLFNLYALLYTQSRGALIVYVLSFTSVYIYSIYRQKAFIKRLIKNSFSSLFLFLIAVSVALLINSDLFSFINQLVGEVNELKLNKLSETEGIRITLIDRAWNSFSLNPIAGIGTHNFLYQNKLLTHNQYLQFASENGFFIFSLFLVALVSFLIAFVNKIRLWKDNDLTFFTLFSITAFVIVYLLFINAFDNPFILSWLLVATIKLDEKLLKWHEV